MEFEAFLESGRGDLRTLANIVSSALYERLVPTLGGEMDPHSRSFGAIVKQPTAFLPLAMSLTALAVVLGSVAIFGVIHEADEGATAHIWQLLMAGQLPVLLFFVVKWLPRAPKQTLCVLALQAGAVLAAMAPVYFLGL
jgi:hypothetical protein